MKLFYQLSREEQDAAIEHCAELVATNAIEHGLKIEAIEGEEGAELKARIEDVLDELKERTDLKSREDKVEFLLQNPTFADTLFELAAEMAHNAFYHERDELVIFRDTLEAHAGSSAHDDEDDDLSSVEELLTPRTTNKKLLN